MKKDFYLWSTADEVLLGHNLTLDEATNLKSQLDSEYPDEAHLSVIGCVSDDPATAARRAFAHLANW